MPIDYSAFVIDRVDLSSILSVPIGLASPEWSLEQLRKQVGNDIKVVAKTDNRGTLDHFKPAWARIDPFFDICPQLQFCNTGVRKIEQADALIIRDGSRHNLRFTDAAAY